MDSRKLALSVLLAGSLVGAVGCGGSGNSGTDGGSGGGDTCNSGSSHFYVMNVLDVGHADPSGDPNVVPGFNLDNMDSGAGNDQQSCYQPDYVAPDGTPGIDNTLGPILFSLGSSVNLEDMLKMSISSGKILVLAKVDNVDSFTNDPCVTLTLLVGQAQPGVIPMLDSMGLLTPGQTFDIKNTSYMADMMTPLVQVQGKITNGKLTAGPVELNLSLPFMGNTLNLTIHTAQVAADITTDTLTNGVIGGALNVDEVVSAVQQFLPDYADTVMMILGNQADLGYDSASMMCKQVSIGLTFSGVTAVMGNIVAPADGGTAMPDAGSPPPSDAGTPPSDGGSGSDAGSAADGG